MTVKEKISNFLFVHRPEIDNKWWNRLFTVFLFGSAIIVFILTVYLTVSSYYPNWVIYGDQPLAFSLEPNYQKISGKELPCDLNLFAFPVSATEPAIDGEGMNCKGVILSDFDSKRYATLYNSAEKTLEKQYGFDKYFDDSMCTGGSPSANQTCEFDSFNKGETAEQADPSYGQYLKDYNNLARIKVSETGNLGNIILDVTLWIAIPVLVLVVWILFWSFIFYRTLLYIIYGKQK